MLQRNAPVSVAMRDRALGLAAIVFLASMGGVWLAASHPATTAGDATAQGTFHTADLLVDNTATFSAMTPSTLMTVNASKQLTPYAGTTLANDGGGTACTIGTGGTGNCNQVVLGASTTPGTIPISLSAPPNNRSIGDNLAGVTISSVSLDMNSHRITSVTDPNLPTDQSAATAHWITAVAASNFSATQGGTVVSPGVATGKFLRDDNSWQTVSGGITSTAGILSADFGTGQDGACNFDGIATVCGAVPSSSVYTLGRDCDCANGTIASGKRVFENGFHLRDTGTLTCSGSIDFNGNSASGTTGAASVSSGYYPATSQGNTEAQGAGGNSAELFDVFVDIGTVAGGLGNGQNPGLPGTIGGSHQGGSGASGGGCTGQGQGVAGKSTGSVTHALATRGNAMTSSSWFDFRYSNRAVAGSYGVNAGGGGGGAGFGGSNGGAAGAGGGVAYVAARKLAGTCTLSANGGNGGNGGAGNGSTVGQGGGGGGGGGGYVYLEYVTNSGTWTVTANGGTHGNGAPLNGTCFAGGNGGDGGAGLVQRINLSGDGT